MKKSMLFIMCIWIIMAFPGITYADKSGMSEMYGLMRSTTFLTPNTSPATLDNGLLVNFYAPIAEGEIANRGNQYWVTSDAPGPYSYSYTLTLKGVVLELQNTSNQVLIIRWAESAINSGNFSGIPFLDGMKYMDAGNPAATPNTILAPGQTLQKNIYISRTTFDRSWTIDGIPIPKKDGLTISVTMKVIDGNNNSRYFNLVSPAIGVPANTRVN